MQVVPRLQRSFLNSFCQRRALHELLTSSPRKTLFVNPNPDPQRSRRGASLRSQRAFTSSSTLRESKKTEEPVDTGKSSELSTPKSGASLRENIYTIPNVLTVSRIVACPVLGWAVLEGNYEVATGLLVYAGLSDLVDGHLARKYNMGSVLGTILDPAADKILMTTLVVTLTMQNMIPLPLAVVILGRDVLLSLSAFIIRYRTLPPPKTWSRYWDVGLPSAEVRPTTVSKVNTALQLLLMGVTTASPLLPEMGLALQGLQWTVATTTIWSGLQYLTSNDAVKIVAKKQSGPL